MPEKAIKAELNLNTSQPNTWCPGCLNFATLAMLKRAIAELHAEGVIDADKTVLVTDIGCGGKIYDFINMNAVYALHGRVIPLATGIRAARPDLTVIGFAGDGGTYDEGMNHLIHSAARNVNMTMIVANNGVFALTKGQPTSLDGGTQKPLNALVLAADAGATFVARASAFDPKGLLTMLKQAVTHEGFSLVDILQPCLIFNNDEGMKNATYDLPEGADKNEALRKEDGRMPIGVFVDVDKKTWGEF